MPLNKAVEATPTLLNAQREKLNRKLDLVIGMVIGMVMDMIIEHFKVLEASGSI